MKVEAKAVERTIPVELPEALGGVACGPLVQLECKFRELNGGGNCGLGYLDQPPLVGPGEGVVADSQ
jgi:hypothetical protein